MIPEPARIPRQNGATLGPLHLKSSNGLPEIQSVSFNHGYVDGNSGGAYGWVGIDLLEIRPGATGENVARVMKTYRLPGATAAAWAFNPELTDYSGIGHIWGGEVNIMSKGRDAAHTRRGVGLVLGEAVFSGAPTYQEVYIDVGFNIEPFRRDVNGAIVPDNVRVGTAYKCDAPCDVFLRCRAGERLYLSTDVYFVFQNSGFIEFFVEGSTVPAMALQMSLKQLFVGGKRVLTEA